MRVAMIGPFGLRRRGTMRFRALPLAKALAARGHQVRLLLPPWDSPEDSAKSWQEEGVEVVNIPLPPHIPLLWHLFIAFRLLRQALRDGPQVVHAFKPKAYSGMAMELLWWGRKPGLLRAGLVMDSDDWEGPGGWNELREDYGRLARHLFAWQERTGMRHCHALTVASRSLQTLAWSLGVDPKKVFYLPNGIWPHQREASEGVPPLPQGWEGKPLVLLYSRLFEVDPERLVRILGLVSREVPEARFLWVGESLLDGGERLVEMLDEIGLEGRLHATGWVEGGALWGYLSRADVAIHPYEDNLVNRAKCSAKLLDLMAAGLPVVADDVGENREYLEDGASGFLVKGGSAEDFARRVIGLLEDEDLRRGMGESARQRAWEEFHWRRLAVQAEGAYQVALERAGGSR